MRAIINQSLHYFAGQIGREEEQTLQIAITNSPINQSITKGEERENIISKPLLPHFSIGNIFKHIVADGMKATKIPAKIERKTTT